MRVLGRLERYVMTQTLMGVAGALAVLGSVVLLIDFVELSRDVGSRAEASFVEVLGLAVMKSPSTIILVLPFVFLFGVQFAFGALNRRSELVAMRAAGVSAWRFIAPAAVASFVIGLFVTGVFSPVSSVLAGRFEATREAVLGSGDATPEPQEVWLRQGDDQTQVVIRAAARDGDVLKGVSMLFYDVRGGRSPAFVRRLEAAEARLVAGEWRLSGVRDARPGAVAVASDRVSVPTTLDPRSALGKTRPPEAVPFWKLREAIDQTRQAGFSTTLLRMRFHQLLVTPLTLMAMAVLAAGFSLRLLRLGGYARLAAAAAGLGFVFFFLTQLCIALGKAGIVPPILAAWIPPILGLLTGVTLLFNTEDG